MSRAADAHDSQRGQRLCSFNAALSMFKSDSIRRMDCLRLFRRVICFELDEDRASNTVSMLGIEFTFFDSVGQRINFTNRFGEDGVDLRSN